MGMVIHGALAVIPGEKGPEVAPHTIYIEGTTIAALDEAPHGFEATTVIDGTGHLVIPGLINAHTHTYMSMMRNAADDLSFSDWLFNTIEPIEDKLLARDAYWGSLLGQIEMIRTGTTCFNDMQMHVGQTTKAVRESGMRAVICRGLVGDAADRSDARLTEALAERAENADVDRLTFRLGPHAPYSCGPDYLRMVAEVAAEEGMGIHIHVAESASETDAIREKYGCTPVEYVERAGAFDVPCVAAHCVRVSPHDMQILAAHDVSVVTNPASNMKLGNGFAPVPELMEAGVNVCLGTDGAASNNAQNMVRELGLLALVHKGTHDTPQCVSATQAFLAATANGARALGLNTGSIEPGKLADLALIDLATPAFAPNNNPVAALAYSATGTEVTTVIINGALVMRNRELLTIDEGRVYFEVDKMRGRLGLS